jgi:hypothetical protein
LKPGDKIEIIQDEDNPEDWYFAKTESGFKTQRYSSTKGVMFNKKILAEKLLKSLGRSETTSFPIGAEPKMVEGLEVWSIITASVKEPKYLKQ